MRILSIETSCDETAVAIVEVNPPSHKASEGHLGQIKVLSNIVSSQVKLHAKYGGVVPNLAAREHVKNIEHVFKLALIESRSRLDSIDLIAVTRGPGLGPTLLIGIAFAKTLAWKYKKPLVGVNHLEGHIYSNWLPRAYQLTSLPAYQLFPILNLIVSGGHTELVLMSAEGGSASGGENYKLIGETLDDAVGEAFDKVARLLGLGYPGGPAIAARAAKLKIKNGLLRRSSHFGYEGREKLKIIFPRPMEKSKDYNFSYSGLKTSVLYKIRDLEKAGIPLSKDVVNEICYEFQKAATEVLIQKTIKAAKEYGVKSIFLSGGVSANSQLRSDLNKAARELGVNYSQPELEYTGDNAAMIALAGYINKVKMAYSAEVATSATKAGKNDPFDKTQGHPEQSRTDEKLKIKTDWKSVQMDANLGFGPSV